MPLIDLWKNSRSQLEGKNVQQLVVIAEAGKLLDGGDASEEFREFLSTIPSALLSRYASECLTDKFEGSGFALQDVVNQIGRRLGFRVEDGRYRGVAGQSGHDGLWRSSFADEWSFVLFQGLTRGYVLVCVSSSSKGKIGVCKRSLCSLWLWFREYCPVYSIYRFRCMA
jgi:hypothetical protein